jgi:hypothetical protein
MLSQLTASGQSCSLHRGQHLAIQALIIRFHIFKILSFTMITIPLDWNLRE